MGLGRRWRRVRIALRVGIVINGRKSYIRERAILPNSKLLMVLTRSGVVTGRRRDAAQPLGLAIGPGTLLRLIPLTAGRPDLGVVFF